MKKGVTLLEMLIVIAIIGILSAVTAPTISNYLPGVQLNGTTRVLSSNLRETQERAVTEQKQYLIRFYPESGPAYYQMIRVIDGNEEIIKKIELPSSESLTLEESITNQQIIFSPDGGPSSSGDITLTNKGVSKAVNVSPAGFIKII